ncbi:hypothetical protein OGAPHI_001056 [Ogataea philodendri]|uniref:Transcriptional regulatory protein SDS3 n=1 Tax=Ogataea philodendri TaxID=1378263 RepID=A0A9P8PES0_9ASCO|nr:uncharacterized protein OGAPHI_001056 [Ogataea philodendri]KAH3670541.1 hypothetical protein OGAPHI_001056 [Ogataea philodendri]
MDYNLQYQLSKKDKRRQQIQSKLVKVEDQFQQEKDYFYRDSLIQLQYKLSSLHSGDNPQYLQRIRDFQEQRDAELVRLKLAEEYQVQFINKQFKEDYDRAVDEREKVIQMVKDKLHERILKKIKQLKEDKALIDVATTSSSHTASRYTSNGSAKENGYNSGFESSTSFFFPGERRSRRTHSKRYESGPLHLSNAEDSYDSGTGTGTGNGYASSSGRKRFKLTRHLGSGQTMGTRSGDASSAGEETGSSVKVVTDNPELNEFLYGEEFIKRQEKANTRHSTKSYQGCPGLKPEEVNEDLNFLRGAVGAIQIVTADVPAGPVGDVKDDLVASVQSHDERQQLLFVELRVDDLCFQVRIKVSGEGIVADQTGTQVDVAAVDLRLVINLGNKMQDGLVENGQLSGGHHVEQLGDPVELRGAHHEQAVQQERRGGDRVQHGRHIGRGLQPLVDAVDAEVVAGRPFDGI